MATQSLPAHGMMMGAAQVLGWIARLILVVITAFWLWFCIADGLGDARELGFMGFLMMMPAALITLGTLYVAWRWEYAGAYVLLGLSTLGIFAAVHNVLGSTLPPDKIPGQAAMAFGLMVVPFLTASILLFVKCAMEKQGN